MLDLLYRTENREPDQCGWVLRFAFTDDKMPLRKNGTTILWPVFSIAGYELNKLADKA